MRIVDELYSLLLMVVLVDRNMLYKISHVLIITPLQQQVVTDGLVPYLLYHSQKGMNRLRSETISCW